MELKKPDIAIWSAEGEDPEASKRFFSRALASFELILKGDIREPTEEEIAAKVLQAQSLMGAGAFRQ